MQLSGINYFHVLLQFKVCIGNPIVVSFRKEHTTMGLRMASETINRCRFYLKEI